MLASVVGSSRFIVQFRGDSQQRHRPIHQLLVHRMREVGLKCRFIAKLHYPTVGKTLRTRRCVRVVTGLDQPGNLSLQRANCLRCVSFVLLSSLWFPLEQECVNNHLSSSNFLQQIPTFRYNCARIVASSSSPIRTTRGSNASTSSIEVRKFTMHARKANRPWITAFERYASPPFCSCVSSASFNSSR